MKKITVKGIELFYEVCEYISKGFEVSYRTKFYLTSKIKTYKKYWLFGKLIKKEVGNEFVFLVYFNIESPFKSKEDLKKILEEGVTDFIINPRVRETAFKKRMEEIKNGNLI